MNKTKLKMNKPIYLGLPVLEISKTVMYQFWYDYVKLKSHDKAYLSYLHTDSFIEKTKNDYKDIINDVEKRFDVSSYEIRRPLPTEKNKKVIGLIKYNLGEKIVTEFLSLRPKTYFYLRDNGSGDNKAKETKTHRDPQSPGTHSWNKTHNFLWIRSTSG